MSTIYGVDLITLIIRSSFSDPLSAMTDIRNEENRVFNITLAKLTGLYQMLDPGTAKFLGRNVYKMFAAVFLSYLLVSTVVLVVGFLHLWTYDTSLSILQFFLAINSFYACYKMCIIFRHSDDLWDCLSITRYGFTSSGFRECRNGHDDVLDRWRARTVRYTSSMTVAYSFSVVFYIRCHRMFGDAIRPIKNLYGFVGNYRWNVLNLSFLTSDETYNEHYNTFFVIEALFIVVLSTFYLIFDILLMTLCMATCCQMQMICDAFKSVNHKSLLSDHRSSAIDNTDEKQIISNKHNLIYDELITNIISHQAVIKKFELFLTIFERVMLSQIFISSISLVILGFNLTMSFFNDGTFAISGDTTVKTIVAIPSILFQIFMACYLFENINDQKDSVIYSLYSSNWTEMDMKCKKLILLTMQLNNANQKKLRFSRIKIVNMEMFFKTMGHCYSVLSVLINYMNSKND